MSGPSFRYPTYPLKCASIPAGSSLSHSQPVASAGAGPFLRFELTFPKRITVQSRPSGRTSGSSFAKTTMSESLTHAAADCFGYGPRRSERSTRPDFISQFVWRAWA